MRGLIACGLITALGVVVYRTLISAVLYFAHTDVSERLADNVGVGDSNQDARYEDHTD